MAVGRPHRIFSTADHRPIYLYRPDQSSCCSTAIETWGAARLADYGWQERAAEFFCEAADFRVAVGLGGVAGEANRGAIESL